MNGWFESERRSLHRAATGKLRDVVSIRCVCANGRCFGQKRGLVQLPKFHCRYSMERWGVSFGLRASKHSGSFKNRFETTVF